MERTATAGAADASARAGAPLPAGESRPPPDAPLPAGEAGPPSDVPLPAGEAGPPLDAMPRQRPRGTRCSESVVRAAAGERWPDPPGRRGRPVREGATRGRSPRERPVGRWAVPRPVRLMPLCEPVRSPLRLLPGPAGTPFTFGYALLLTVTSLVASYADPAVVDALHQGSSTDVAHLVRAPLLVLPASALWLAGGPLSPYALCLLLVLTALERRIGGPRTAGVFLFGHVVATLATEVPVGLAVLAGRLPDSSLHRLDYGVSFGVAAAAGALAGLLRPWARWPLLAVFAGTAVRDLLTFADPMTSWGHLIAVALGVATWPVVRRRARPHAAAPGHAALGPPASSG
ncbi:rhomboid-like protein [Streptomyces sp. NPDC004065]|uniref:rhomboid-like protein n=1 Tax=Streptomyces sp. NPDC004065 TaxID=3364689 RepID=UPI003850EEC0